MKKTFLLTAAVTIAALAVLTNCKKQTTENNNDKFTYNVDKFYDLEVLRYRVEGFEQLSLQQKQLIYYLSEAALQGRDICMTRTAVTICVSAVQWKLSICTRPTTEK